MTLKSLSLLLLVSLFSTGVFAIECKEKLLNDSFIAVPSELISASSASIDGCPTMMGFGDEEEPSAKSYYTLETSTKNECIYGDRFYYCTKLDS